MAEVAGRTQPQEGRGDLATEIPSCNLPPVPYADLPEPKKLTQIIGASVIILATGETALTSFARYWKPWWWLFNGYCADRAGEGVVSSGGLAMAGPTSGNRVRR